MRSLPKLSSFLNLNYKTPHF